MKGIKKKILIGVLSIILICSFVLIGFFWTTTPGKEIDSPEYIVKTALRCQYGWESKDKLKEIAIEEMYKDVNEMAINKKLYLFADKEKLDAELKELSKKEKAKIAVEIYAPIDVEFYNCTLEKQKDGKYRIVNVEIDT